MTKTERKQYQADQLAIVVACKTEREAGRDETWTTVADRMTFACGACGSARGYGEIHCGQISEGN